MRVPVPTLPVTVLILSDFEIGRKTWADEIACVASFTSDPQALPAEIVVLAPEADFADSPAPDWSASPVPVRLHSVRASTSTDLKNAGTALAAQALVAVVEADSPCQRGWLLKLYERITATPDLQVVSGITIYEPCSSLRRVMSMYDRGYLLTPSRDGDVVQFSSNGALFRRELLARYPLPNDKSPFIAAHKRQRAWVADQIPMAVVADAVQIHAFRDWPFVRDVRRNKAYQYARMQELVDPRLAASSPLRRTCAALLTSFQSDWRNLIRLFPFYCRWYDLPLAIVMLVVNRVFEWPGAGDALRGLELPGQTAFR
jgi:hypothetical protein